MPLSKRTTRPTSDEYFMLMATLVSTRGTCARRMVGCVLVNQRNHVMATGYNGVASGLPHCIDVPCPGAKYKSGTGLDQCQAIHAEQNALLQCYNVHEIMTVYCTTMPCIHCVKLLLNTSCKRIVFRNIYAHHKEVQELWLSAGRQWSWIS